MAGEKFADYLNGHLRINCGKFPEIFALISCDILESMSQNYLILADVLTLDVSITAEDLIDETFIVELDLDEGKRYFCGNCTDVKFVDQDDRSTHIKLELRPAFWHLSRRVDTRLFVDMMSMDTMRQVFGDAGFSDFDDRRSQDETDTRELIVQYNESDFAFISRLLEDEGSYFFFEHKDDGPLLVLCDGPASHAPVPEHSIIDFKKEDTVFRGDNPCIFAWDEQSRNRATTFSTTDYDFTKINADLSTESSIQGIIHNPAEVYTYPGGYSELPDGERLMRLKMEALVAASERVTGKTNVLQFGIGQSFTLAGLDETSDLDYLVLSTRIRLEGGSRDKLKEDGRNPYVCNFEALHLEKPYRSTGETPRPIIAGVQTAEVVGPTGKEIYTDEFGRVKVQFHWDRVNQRDENSSCWIRVSTPWAGRGWGTVAVPRIGQEVVVQFEEGNPDRPLITGMLFNKKNMPPNGLPAAASQMGMRSNSTPGGGGANEIVMEDKKGAEGLNTIAERDYSLTVKNDAQINVGYEVGAQGNYTLNVFQNRFENVSNGDFNIGVDTGSRNTYVNTDDTVSVDGNRTEKIKNTLGSEAKDITMNGTTTLKIESPDVDINGKTKTKIGSAAIEVDGTTIKISGKAEILLSVGGSSIKLDASGVTIAGPLVKIN